MKRKVFAIAFLTILSALCVKTTFVHAQPDEITVKPTDDTYTTLQYPNSTYGGQPYLEVISSPLNQSIVLLKFNLSSIPIGAVIDKVTLQLYTLVVVSGPYSIGATYLASNSWNESTLTNNGYFSLGAGIYLEGLSDVLVGSNNQWYSWDETTAFNYARSDVSLAEITLVLLTYSVYSPYSYVWFASREYADYSPRLTVHWSSIVPEFPPIALVPSFMIVTSLIAVYYRTRNKTHLSKKRNPRSRIVVENGSKDSTSQYAIKHLIPARNTKTTFCCKMVF
jgi:hypothetical protein